jgi:serine/threonine protein kinase/Tfp pilus assembly protein PilF
MDRERWERLSRILDGALERPPEHVAAYLDLECRGDPALRSLAEQALRAEAISDGILDRPPPLPESPAPSLETDPPAPAFPDELLIAGQRIGPFLVLEEIGRGGMGVVYLAERADGAYEQRVALKRMKRGLDTDEILSRFVRERHILARLEHPHIARLLDGGAAADGLPYLAMEYVEGEPITEYCARTRAALAEILSLFAQVCGAVQFAHERFVVHRDLKPANILVTRTGDVKLLDFGIAKLLDVNEGSHTIPAARRLTPHYAAPEQWGADPPTAATDVYSLGVLLHELVTGRLPGPEASGVGPERLKGDLKSIVRQALQPAPADRYPSAAALLADVEALQQGRPVRATRPTPLYRARKFVARNRAGVAIAAMGLASLLLGLAGTSWQAHIAARERDRARAEAAKAETINRFMLSLFQSVDPNVSKGKAITAREMLDQGAARVNAELRGQPGVQAELLHTLGGLYRQVSDLDHAQKMYERALAIRRERGGPPIAKSRESAAILADLGAVLGERGDYERALAALHEAHAAQTAILGEAHPDVAGTTSKMATVYHAMGRYDEADSLYRRALRAEERALGTDHPRVADELDRIGTLLYSGRRVAEAVPLHERALAIRLRTLGRENLATATAMENVANVIGETGQVARAESLHLEALHIIRRLYGADHYLAINALKNLAGHYLSRRSWERAQVPALEALRVARLNFGDEHPLTALMEHNAAMMHSYFGRFALAESLIGHAQSTWRQTLGANYVIALHSRNSLAEIYLQEGRLDEAERLMTETLATKERILGKESYQIPLSLISLGRLRRAQGRAAEAEALLRRALGLSERAFGAAHFRNGEPLSELAGALYDQGRFSEAREIYERAVRLVDRALEPGSNLSTDASIGWGRALAALGETARADSVLRAAVAARRMNPHQWPVRLAEADGALGTCLERSGRAADAEPLLVRSLPILRRSPVVSRSLVREVERSLDRAATRHATR